MNPSPLKVAFYGDSIVTGWRGVTSIDRRWTSLICQRLGWDEINIAANGLGFVRWRGPDRANSGEPLGLIDEVLAATADLVVVALGGNDSVIVDQHQAEIEQAMSRDLEVLVDAFGVGRVLVLDLYSPHGAEKPPGWTKVRALLSAACDEMGLPYVRGQAGAIGGDRRLLCGDLVHPNDAGHEALADAVLDDLRLAAESLEPV